MPGPNRENKSGGREEGGLEFPSIARTSSRSHSNASTDGFMSSSTPAKMNKNKKSTGFKQPNIPSKLTLDSPPRRHFDSDIPEAVPRCTSEFKIARNVEDIQTLSNSTSPKSELPRKVHVAGISATVLPDLEPIYLESPTLATHSFLPSRTCCLAGPLTKIRTAKALQLHLESFVAAAPFSSDTEDRAACASSTCSPSSRDTCDGRLPSLYSDNEFKLRFGEAFWSLGRNNNNDNNNNNNNNNNNDKNNSSIGPTSKSSGLQNIAPATTAMNSEETGTTTAAGVEWPPGTTTVMLKNIPNRYTAEELVSELSELGFEAAFDFFYLPIDFLTKKNKGYAFVNLKFSRDVDRLRQMLYQRQLTRHTTAKMLELLPAATQGFEANAKQYLRTQVKRVQNPWFKPMVWLGSSSLKRGSSTTTSAVHNETRKPTADLTGTPGEACLNPPGALGQWVPLSEDNVNRALRKIVVEQQAQDTVSLPLTLLQSTRQRPQTQDKIAHSAPGSLAESKGFAGSEEPAPAANQSTNAPQRGCPPTKAAVLLQAAMEDFLRSCLTDVFSGANVASTQAPADAAAVSAPEPGLSTRRRRRPGQHT